MRRSQTSLLGFKAQVLEINSWQTFDRKRLVPLQSSWKIIWFDLELEVERGVFLIIRHSVFFLSPFKRNCLALLREWRWLNFPLSGQQAKRRRSGKRHRPQNRGHLGPEPLPYQVTTQKKVKQILHHFWNLPHRPSKVDQQIWVCQARVKPSQGGEQGQDGFQGDENFNRWDWDIFLLQKYSDSAG